MGIRYPTQEQAFNFIAGSHQADRLKCSYADVAATYKQKSLNYFADGHLKAINYIFTELLDKLDFPCRDPRTLTSRFKSHQALGWLRELHARMLTPLLNIKLEGEPDPQNPLPLRSEIGSYRLKDTYNSFSSCPSPNLIPFVLHNWLANIAALHFEIKPKLDLAFGISKEISQKLEDTTYESLLFFCTVQPFPCANNRLGRLVENTLRLQWRLPWRVTQKDAKYEEFIADLVKYQQTKLPLIIRQALQLQKELK